MKNVVPSKGLEWTNFIMGACLACSALFFTEFPAVWDAVIVGAIIASCSAVALSRYRVWTEWANLALGCWAAVAPFILKFGSLASPTWIHVTVGLCVALFASIQLLASKKSESGSANS